MSEEKFKRVTIVRLPFEARSQNPREDYGHGGLRTCHVLVGPKGATHFEVYWPYYLPRSRAMWRREGLTDAGRDDGPVGGDVGYHALEPQYEGQQPSRESCEHLGGKPCYMDGSGLLAQDWADEIFSEHGFPEEKIWKRLEAKYIERFGEP